MKSRGGLRGFHRAQHNISLCVQLTDHRCRKRRMGQQISPPELSGSGPRMQPSDTCRGGTVNVSVMGLRDGDGNEHTVIHQPSMALLPFRYRYPLRDKAPAASSGRLTHNIGHQCNTAPFSPLRNALSQHPERLSIHPSARSPHNGQKWIHRVFKRRFMC